MSDYELKRINALPEASAINDSDVFAIDSAAGTKKVAWETLKGEVDADISEAVSNKADADGTYPDMAVGSVLGTNTVTDREPYFLRPSASIGDREFDTLVGGSLGWNQLSHEATISLSQDGLTLTENANGLITISGESTLESGYTNFYLLGKSVLLENNHVYCVNVVPKTDSGTTDMTAVVIYSGNGGILSCYNKNGGIVKQEGTPTGYSSLYIRPRYSFNGTLSFYLSLIDLTTLFGSTIADYIYSLETANAGDGVAWVRKYLPDDYYAYCAPTLKHVSGVSAHVMRDANNNVIGNYAIDSTWVGMGVPKLDSANKLYFDGDTYASDGTVTERFGIVDLGTLHWNRLTVGANNIFYVSTNDFPSDAKAYASNTPSNMDDMLLAKYTRSTQTSAGTWEDKSFFFGGSYFGARALSICNSAYNSATASEFESAMSGEYFLYPLATPTASTASPFTSPQICDPSGTEEYVTTGLVPVGHETEYVENLADKLTDIPDLPTTEGTYHLNVTVSGGVPSYSWVSA